MSSPLETLHQLADAYGVETGYDDDQRRRRDSSPETLLAVLRVLGAPVTRIEDAGDALRQRRLAGWHAPPAAGAVAWDGRAEPLRLRLPAAQAGSDVRCSLTLEDGVERSWTSKAHELPEVHGARVEGTDYTERLLR